MAMGLLHRLKGTIAALQNVRTVQIPCPTDNADLLHGRLALITGGTGGIGSAIAETFLSAGARVIIAGRNQESLNSVRSKLGDGASTVTFDLSRPETFPAALSTLPEYPDILVNSGGVLSQTPFGQITLEEYERVMDANVKGMLFLSQEVSNQWIASGTRGNILNISSGSQFKPGWTTYQVSKNAVDALTRGMASFLVGHGIVVNAIAPGPVATAMLGMNSGDLAYPHNPTGRLVTPQEVAQWGLYLVGDLGRYAVGSTFALTGGNGIFQWERQEKFRPR